MKIHLIVLLLICNNLVWCQEPRNLEKYLPNISHQDGNNCYAYATAYVALSTQINCRLNVPSDSTSAFSFGFVDGAIDYLIKTNGRRNFRKMVGSYLYQNENVALGNLDYAFYAIKRIGTVPFKVFPYTSKSSIRKHFKQEMLSRSDLVKINGINQLASPDSLTDVIISNIKSEIDKQKPVICSIVQPSLDCTWENLSFFKPAPKLILGNHIVTIYAYNDEFFYIKNNYEKDCTGMYKQTDFLKILKWAYTLDIK